MPNKTLDGKGFKDLFIAGSIRLDESREYLNSINVFPVPDGDTGSNMAETLKNAVVALGGISDHSLPHVLETLSRHLRMEAKGNSGIILAEFFHGMFLVLREKEVVDPGVFIRGMSNGRKAAYSALAEPKEGTILTLISKTANKLSEVERRLENMRLALEEVVKTSQKALAETTDEMPLLKSNNVVDSGAHGFLLFWEGALSFINGDFRHKLLKPVKMVFTADRSEEITYRYCIEGLVRFAAFDREAMKSRLQGMGDSLIITGDGELLKTHIHTNDPAAVFKYLESLGQLVKTKAEDMLAQHREKVGETKKIKVGIVTDSTCDLDLDRREDLGVVMIPLQIIFGGESFRDRIDITADEFYQRLKRSETLPRTSLPKASDFLDGYEEAPPSCKTILGIFISATLSGTWQAGKKWGEEFGKKEVVAYDSGQASLAMGLMVIEASRMAAEGKEAPEIIARLDEIRGKLSTYFTVDTLEFLEKNGRIGAAERIIGQMVGLKPILKLKDGVVCPCAKAIGARRMFDKLINQLKVDAEKPGFEGNFAVAWSDNPEARDELIHRIRAEFEVKTLVTGRVSPVVGAHTGPGALGVFCY